MTTDDPIAVTKGSWIDLGGGVSIRELRNAAGVLLGIHWRHGTGWCATIEHNFVPTKAYSDDGWTVVKETPLTLAESLLCVDKTCNAHGHIRNGAWEPC